jgi:hypothetical protein
MSLHQARILAVLITLSLFLTGCNAFEAFDRNINQSDFSARLGEARLELASANFANALDLFNRLIEEHTPNDEVWRGRASAQAGLAGFNMFTVLERLQNDVIVPDTAAVFFVTSRIITDNSLLDKAIEDMHKVKAPTADDKLFRSLMACIFACRSLQEKYDTSLNRKFDTPDQIDFDTRDDKTPQWPELFTRLTSASSPYSLEKAFIELSHSLDGRGTSWITISPVQGISHTGLYTPANRSTILAAGNFADAIEEINNWFGNSEARFKELILALDGIN